MPDRFVMSASGVRRVKRALEIVEQGPQPLPQGVNYNSPATWRLAVSSCGASPGTTTTFSLTRLNSTQVNGFATNSTFIFAAMDYFKWGLVKNQKMMAFRPIPDRNWWAYQPPAIRYGYIKSFTTGQTFDTAIVHYADGAAGASVDTGTTINIEIVHRTGRTLDLTTGEIMAFAPDLGGGFHPVSDYSEANAPTTSQGSFAWHGKVLITDMSERTTDTVFKFSSWNQELTTENESRYGFRTTSVDGLITSSCGDTSFDRAALRFVETGNFHITYDAVISTAGPGPGTSGQDLNLQFDAIATTVTGSSPTFSAPTTGFRRNFFQRINSWGDQDQSGAVHGESIINVDTTNYRWAPTVQEISSVLAISTTQLVDVSMRFIIQRTNRATT